MAPDLRRQDGVIIIAVLWICAMIMWFALQIAAETRLKGEEQVHLFRRSQALHLAIGGSYEALAQMAQANSSGLDDMSGRFSAPTLRHRGDKRSPDDPWQPDGEPHLVDYQTGQALIIIEAEGRKVNVNRTNNAQLKLVMEKAGLEEDEAERLTDVFLDFIDKDDITRLHGAEKEQYQSLGLPYGPFNGPLTSLDQMLLIPGITQQVYYGYGMKSEEEAAREEEESEVPQIPALPAKYSLFRMLTVYGKNVNFQDDSKTDPFDDDNEREQIRWEKGGIYRIFSCGRTFNGPPTIILWMVIRYSPETPKGYEVLYRKIL
jgi:general secretion pathway protein K